MIHGLIRKKAQVEGKWGISKGDGILKGDEVFYFYSVFCQQITVTSMSAFLYLHQNNQIQIDCHLGSPKCML